ncbi:MAG: UBP-type zinc finger domain-containing protein [Acidimicrobiales bacterium]
MSRDCSHIPTDLAPPAPQTTVGCTSCLAEGRHDWVHLRECQSCGHVGCCDNSPARHATAHAQHTSHPLIRSMEPGENWWWCYVDEVAFEIDGAPPSPTRTA